MLRKVVGCCLLILILFAPVRPGRAERNGFVLTAATANSSTEAEAVVLAEFKRLLEERSNGFFKVDLYGSGVLGSDEQLIRGLQRGTVDLITCATFKYADYVPEFSVLDLPFLFFSTEHLRSVLEGKLGKVLTVKAQESRGDYLLGYITGGPVNIVSNKALINLSQSKGLRLRTMLLPSHRRTWETLGMIPVTLAFSELKIGLQVGIVDAVETNFLDYKQMRLFETARFILQSEHYFPLSLLILSKAAWQRIPSAYRGLIQDCALEASRYGSNELIWQNNEAAREMTEKYGVKINVLKPAEKKTSKEKLVAYQEKTFATYGLAEAWAELKTTYTEYESNALNE
ncbi:MAG TPA: TRAP transporter substrate-binding protein [Capillibacterium sp.]